MRRISRIEVDNFKSLVDFHITLPKFSCLIGLNGSGKSTVLQFLDFLSRLFRGNMTGWLEQRRWKASDLKSKLTKRTSITIGVEWTDEQGKPAGRWDAVYSPSKGCCTKERLELPGAVLTTLNGKIGLAATPSSQPRTWKTWESKITFSYEGSILASLREEILPSSIVEFKQALTKIGSIELLAPELLKQRTRASWDFLELGGHNLASVLHQMIPEKRHNIENLLKRALPNFNGLGTRSFPFGWKQLAVSESYSGADAGFFPAMTTEARHVSDGLLRMIAMLAELQSDNRFLMFDEIENGINPELAEFVVEQLVEARQQVLVTTHSPVILNELADDAARESVIYVYKTPQGSTKSIPFFAIPSLREKLKVMGPGEAFADTKLTDLAEEIAAVVSTNEATSPIK